MDDSLRLILCCSPDEETGEVQCGGCDRTVTFRRWFPPTMETWCCNHCREKAKAKEAIEGMVRDALDSALDEVRVRLDVLEELVGGGTDR